MPINAETRQLLIATALNARRWAYAPYSHYSVGAAALSASGKIYEGVNVENAAYPTGVCAERVAIFKAVSEGEREFTAIAVATENGGGSCGACRQVMAEFGLSTQLLMVDADGNVQLETTVDKLLPNAFTPEDLT